MSGLRGMGARGGRQDAVTEVGGSREKPGKDRTDSGGGDRVI